MKEVEEKKEKKKEERKRRKRRRRKIRGTGGYELGEGEREAQEEEVT